MNLGLIVRALRRYLRSPYLFLWRTLEIQAAGELAAEHGIDLSRQLDLDVGCGDGIVGAMACRRIALGIDPDRRALRWARREPAYDVLAVATGARLPVAAGSLRLVFSNSVLEHISDDQAVLIEIARVLADAGYLLLTLVAAPLPELALGPGAPADVRRAFDLSLQHVHYYAPDTVAALLEPLGLQVLATRAYLDEGDIARWHRLRAWEGRHPRRGLVLRLYQLLRIPVSLALLPRVLAGPGRPARGGGLAVLARKASPLS
jgi:SAM-dependent methyltransferase